MKRLLAIAAALLLALGAPASAADKDAKAGAKSSVAAEKAAMPADKLDLNSATEQELSQLSGIGEARAKAIIKGRPYRGKDELLARKIVPESVYNKIRDKVVAKQGK